MVKDQEYLENKASYCLDLAKKLGATEASINVGSSISETVNFRNKKLDESNRSDNLGVDITTYIGRKKSSISSSNLLQDNLNILIGLSLFISDIIILNLFLLFIFLTFAFERSLIFSTRLKKF